MKRTVISATVLALAMSGVGVSQAAKPENTGKPAESGFKVTGGGQIIAEGAQGAGDTVGFNAQELDGDDPNSPDSDDAARGQFQYVPRGQSAGTNQEATEKFHGVVTCLISGGEAVANEEAEGDDYEEELAAGMARFGGIVRGTGTGEDNPAVYFTVDVTDNGQGGSAEDDLILVRITDAPCADNPEDEEANDPEGLLRLGRGNVKIHNNPDGETASPATNARAAAAMAAMAL